MPPESAADEREPPLKKALQYLARREYYSAELKWKLMGRGYREDAVDEVIEELTAGGQLSDGRFIEAYITERQRRLYGPERIRMELLGKGFDEARIGGALAQAEDRWLDNARRCCRKRFGEAPPADGGEYAKRRDYLYRRGYSVPLIRAALSDSLSGESGG